MVRLIVKGRSSINLSNHGSDPVHGHNILALMTTETQTPEPVASVRQAEALAQSLKHRKSAVDGLVGTHRSGWMQIDHDGRAIDSQGVNRRGLTEHLF